MAYIKNKLLWVFFLTNCLYSSVLFPFIFGIAFVFALILNMLTFFIVSILDNYLHFSNQLVVNFSDSFFLLFVIMQSLVLFLLVNFILSLIYSRHYNFEISPEGVKIIKGLKDVKERLYSKENIFNVKLTRNFAGLLLGTYDILITPKYGKKSQLALYNPGRVIGLKKEKAEELYRTLLVYAIQNGGDAN